MDPVKHRSSYEYYSSGAKAPDAESEEHASARPGHSADHETDHRKTHARSKKTHNKDGEHKKAKKDKQDNEREVQNTRKTPKPKEAPKDTHEIKQEKRVELVERSLELKKQYEETPVPRDPQILAKLLVADHILAINERIEAPNDPKAAAIDREKLLVALDSMGELASKLEYPESESTPEIQEAYHAVIRLAEHTLENNEPIDTVIEQNANSARSFDSNGDDYDTPASENMAANPPESSGAALALIGFLVGRRNKGASTPPAPFLLNGTTLRSPVATSDGNTYRYTSSSPIASSVSLPPPHSPETHLSTSLSPADARAAYRENTRAEHRTPVRLRSADRIASFAVASTLNMLHNGKEFLPSASAGIPNTHPDKQSYPPRPLTSMPASETGNSYTELVSLSHAQAMPAARYTEMLRPSSATAPSQSAQIHFEKSIPPSATSFSPETVHSGNRKLEHRTLHELLTMAEIVPVGHGQRLRKMYEEGKIDKDGLIKVLKSRSKNYDYIKELRQQVVRRKNLLESSPEFLTSAARGRSDSPQTDTDQDKSSDTISEKSNLQPFLPDKLKEILSSSPTPPSTPTFSTSPPAHTPWLSIIGISLLSIAAGALVYFLVMGT